jgi:hypothetical protein
MHCHLLLCCHCLSTSSWSTRSLHRAVQQVNSEFRLVLLTHGAGELRCARCCSWLAERINFGLVLVIRWRLLFTTRESNKQTVGEALLVKRMTADVGSAVSRGRQHCRPEADSVLPALAILLLVARRRAGNAGLRVQPFGVEDGVTKCHLDGKSALEYPVRKNDEMMTPCRNTALGTKGSWTLCVV